jgi:hypothetical protein
MAPTRAVGSPWSSVSAWPGTASKVAPGATGCLSAESTVASVLADDLGEERRYSAASIAARAAAGQDEEMTALGFEEWGYLTEQALSWLRADLSQWASKAKDPKQWWVVREKLTYWKNDPGLSFVRDPAWLRAMPPADRKAWEALWRDVDALLASIAQ